MPLIMLQLYTTFLYFSLTPCGNCCHGIIIVSITMSITFTLFFFIYLQLHVYQYSLESPDTLKVCLCGDVDMYFCDIRCSCQNVIYLYCLLPAPALLLMSWSATLERTNSIIKNTNKCLGSFTDKTLCVNELLYGSELLIRQVFSDIPGGNYNQFVFAVHFHTEHGKWKPLRYVIR